jgi:hypothetical protein
MSKSTLKILPALMVAIITGWVTQPVNGQTPTSTPVITFTEYSSTNLTAVYTNSSGGTTNLIVTPFPGFTDLWTVALPSDGSLVTFNDAAWLEPSSTTSINNILGQVSSFRVTSDIPLTGPPGAGVLTNNQMTAFPIAIVVGTGPIVFGVFNDLGDVATVPDTGTTASLLGFSLMGLAFLRRKLS